LEGSEDALTRAPYRRPHDTHTHDPHGEGRRLTRRGSLVKLGGLAATALGAAAWKLESASDAEGAASGPAAVSSGLVTCVLSPEMTEGPYFLEGDKVRRDIREGRPGVLLNLRTTVVDVSTCKPLKGAAVDIWQCDAGGVYSGTSVQSTEGATFLRGIQKTDKNGLAVFKTLYPGWYRGRTVHIHVRVFVGGDVVHTGQLFFPDTLTDAVYKRSPYSSRPGRDTRNTTDSIYRNGGSRSLLKLTKNGAGYVGKITMGVQTS
jgi:protocatechuate 3,4-dioxygenase beta subunit